MDATKANYFGILGGIASFVSFQAYQPSADDAEEQRREEAREMIERAAIWIDQRLQTPDDPDMPPGRGDFEWIRWKSQLLEHVYGFIDPDEHFAGNCCFRPDERGCPCRRSLTHDGMHTKVISGAFHPPSVLQIGPKEQMRHNSRPCVSAWLG